MPFLIIIKSIYYTHSQVLISTKHNVCTTILSQGFILIFFALISSVIFIKKIVINEKNKMKASSKNAF